MKICLKMIAGMVYAPDTIVIPQDGRFLHSIVYTIF